MNTVKALSKFAMHIFSVIHEHIIMLTYFRYIVQLQNYCVIKTNTFILCKHALICSFCHTIINFLIHLSLAESSGAYEMKIHLVWFADFLYSFVSTFKKVFFRS